MQAQGLNNGVGNVGALVLLLESLHLVHGIGTNAHNLHCRAVLFIGNAARCLALCRAIVNRRAPSNLVVLLLLLAMTAASGVFASWRDHCYAAQYTEIGDWSNLDLL